MSMVAVRALMARFFGRRQSPSNTHRQRFCNSVIQGRASVTRYFSRAGALLKNLPSWIPALDPAKIDWDKLTIVDIYREIANHYPQAHFSQFNHEQDRVQSLYYAATGGMGLDWSDRMYKTMDDITASTSNFRYFVAPGKSHCAMTSDGFYSTKSDGVVLSNWLTSAVSGQDSQNVKCLECKSQVK